MEREEREGGEGRERKGRSQESGENCRDVPLARLGRSMGMERSGASVAGDTSGQRQSFPA